MKMEAFFARDLNSRTRGHSWKLMKRRCNTTLRQHFFSERVVNLWNRLDEQTVSAQSINQFKHRLDVLRNRDESFYGQYLSY